MRRIIITTAIALAITTTAHAGDITIYPRLLTGVKLCKFTDPDILRQAEFTRAELGRRVMNKEITTKEIDAAVKKAEQEDRAELCASTANVYRIISDASR